MLRVILGSLLGIFIHQLACSDTFAADPLGEMDLTVLDAETKLPIPVRLRMLNSRGRSPRIRNVPRQGDDFTFSDLLTFKMKTGKYQFTIDRGPHYQQRSGTLEVKRDGFDQKTVTLPRFVNMRKEGWYGGDLLVNREPEELQLLMNAEELDIAVRPLWSTEKPPSDVDSRQPRQAESLGQAFVDYSAGTTNANGGQLIAVNFQGKIDSTQFPADALGFAKTAKQAGANLVVLDPLGWDLPALVAYELVDSVAVLTDHLRLDGDVTKSDGKTSTEERFRGQHGSGRYAESIYYHLLNCGLRIPPAAFSGSGDCDNPPGYNRVYVACGQDFTNETWWRNLVAGKSIVSNGPVLRVRANDQLPGYVFKSNAGQKVSINVSCNLGTRQKVEYLDIVRDGRVVESVRLDKWAANGGRLPTIEFAESGWMLVRAYAPGEKNFRCAFSAPFYVQFDEQPRVSKMSAQYFLDWVYERARNIRSLKLPKSELQLLIDQQRFARDYWKALADSANAP